MTGGGTGSSSSSERAAGAWVFLSTLPTFGADVVVAVGGGGGAPPTPPPPREDCERKSRSPSG